MYITLIIDVHLRFRWLSFSFQSALETERATFLMGNVMPILENVFVMLASQEAIVTIALLGQYPTPLGIAMAAPNMAMTVVVHH